MNTVKELAALPAKINGEALKTPPIAIPPVVAFTKVDEKLPPLDERLHRLNVLFELQGKYNRLQTSLQKLKTFNLKKDSDYAGLSITDEKRNEFSTKNVDVTAEVVKFLMTTIQSKIKEIEPLLKW